MHTKEEFKLIQCFAPDDVLKELPFEKEPKLLYVSHPDPKNDYSPRFMHSHKNFVELILIVDGEADFFIDNRLWHVEKGDLVIYNREIVHDESRALEMYCMAVSDIKLPNLPCNVLTAVGQPFIFRTGSKEGPMTSHLSLMYNLLRENQNHAKEHCQYLMLSFLLYVLDIIESRKEEPLTEAEQEERFLGLRTQEYIDHHYQENLTLNSIADSLHVNSYYLSHCFKKQIGYSPIQYLNKRRIGEAQTLLIMTTEPITDIALEIGYNSLGYFDRVFTKEIGLSPKQFREKYVFYPPKGK